MTTSCLFWVPVVAALVYDGDSLSKSPVTHDMGVRLEAVDGRHFDTPEYGWRAACESERAKGAAARDLVRSLMPGAICVLDEVSWPGPRLVGRLVGRDGRDVAMALEERELLQWSENAEWCE